jgi:PAS domain S-box-containing protein
MKKILVVDNDPVMLSLMTKFLEKKGYRVKTAADGLNALDVLETYTPDVMFIDLVMPNIDGEKLCRILRGMDKFKDAYLVILSSISAEEYVDITRFDANVCIAKGPFDEMSQYVLAVLEEPEATCSECLSGTVFGVENVYPRGITKELLSVKKHFEVVMGKMSEGIFEINQEGRIVYANSAALALAAIALEDLLGAYFANLFSKDDRRRVSDLIQKSGVQTIHDDFPVELNRYKVTLSIVPLDEQETSSMIIMHDVTERKKAECALKSAREYAQNIIDSSLDMIISVDNDRNIVEFNRAAERAFGYLKEEVVGRSVNMLYADIRQRNDLLETAYDREKFMGEITNVDKHGNIFPSLLSFAFMKDPQGKVIGSVGVSRDITEQKKLQKELENYRDYLEEIVKDRTKKLGESEKRYRMLFEKAREAIFLLEAEGQDPGNIIEANQAAAKMHGYTMDELVQLNIRDLDAPDEAQKVDERIDRMLQGEWFAGEIRHRRKDGSIFFVDASAGLLELGDKKHILVFHRDVTAHKQALKDKDKLMLKLRHSEKMEAIGTLAGGVAHDLNNILSGIVSYPELILLDLPEKSPLKNPISTIQKSGQKAAAIVQDLLTLARRGVVADTVVNLKEILADYLASAEFEKLTSHCPQVQIETHIEAMPLTVLGSPVHLSKTIMNLVSNAVESIAEKGRVAISLENKYIDQPVNGYETIEKGDYVVLEVKDNGMGIAPEHIDKIFEPFYTKKKMGKSGTGLGMAVVWGTVKDHQGFIDIKSSVGDGTTFTLYFPATKKGIIDDKSTISIKNYLGNHESILIVDDIAEQREIAASILIRLGYDVKTCSSGEEAIAHLETNHADLVVLDIIMEPGIDGLETYKRMLELHPKQKAIIASGFSETEPVKAAQKLGAGTYIKKPYTLEKIGIAVKEELSKM